MAQITHLPGWTARHGINAGSRSVRPLVTQSTGTAHVSANTGDGQTRDFHTHWQAVTACDLAMDAGSWRSPGFYDAADVRNVLENVLELPAHEVSFDSVCKRCARIALAETGIDLLELV